MAHRPKTTLAALTPHTARQHGLFTMQQAEDVGISRSVVDRRVQWEEIVSVDHGVYRSVLTPATWHQRLCAACLAGPAVASHRSAAVLWRMPQRDDNALEVTALRHRRRFAGDVTWHESYLLDDGQVTELDGIPVTTATRTVLDLAGVLGDDALTRVLDDVLRRRLTDVGRLASLLERLGPLRRGADRLRRLLDSRLDAVPESDLETQFSLLIKAHGLPTPVGQFEVPAPDGRRFRIDFAYPEQRVGIELMGAEFHSGPDQWRADTARLGVLASIGWLMLSFTYEQVVFQSTTVVKAVELALAR